MKLTFLLPAAALVALLTACDKAPAPDAADAPTPAEQAPAASVADRQPTAAAPLASGGHACMISGSFTIMNKTIRSRDCIAAKAGSDKATLENMCTQLAQLSAQLGGKAGQVDYMENCPAPAQGSCRNFMSSGYDAYYYERSPEDLADLPESCRGSGGEWH